MTDKDETTAGKSEGESAGAENASPENVTNENAGKEGDAGEESSPENLDLQKPEATIHLDQFLKTCGVATGGQAKVMIQGGEILVNDEIETRRRRQLRVGDEVTLGDDVYVVALSED